MSTATNPEHVYQDKDEAIARTISYSDKVLNNSTISTVTWSVPSGLTNEAVSNTTTSATIRLSGGSPGSTYKVECTVTTAASEDLQDHFLLTVND